LVDYIGNDSTQEVQTTIHDALAKVGTMSPSSTEPYTLLCTYTVQIILGILTALIAVIIAYGAMGATIIGWLGPVFIPWMVFDKTDFLFWGWLKAFIGFEFYKGPDADSFYWRDLAKVAIGLDMAAWIWRLGILCCWVNKRRGRGAVRCLSLRCGNSGRNRCAGDACSQIGDKITA
jgi:hypothetical protein